MVIVGASKIFEGLFYDVDGVLADPTTVTLYVVDPTGTQTAYTGVELTNPAVGTYQYLLVLDQAGVWRWRWQGVGDDGTAVDEGVVKVNDSAIVVAS